MSERRCTVPCEWWHHNYKHFPARGTRKEDTTFGPAKYLPGCTEATIRAIESTTRSGADHVRGGSPAKAQYLRAAGLIGWDQGQDATLSYVECTGAVTSRRFHGRPMHEGNALARRIAGGA